MGGPSIITNLSLEILLPLPPPHPPPPINLCQASIPDNFTAVLQFVSKLLCARCPVPVWTHLDRLAGQALGSERLTPWKCALSLSGSESENSGLLISVKIINFAILWPLNLISVSTIHVGLSFCECQCLSKPLGWMDSNYQVSYFFMWLVFVGIALCLQMWFI